MGGGALLPSRPGMNTRAGCQPGGAAQSDQLLAAGAAARGAWQHPPQVAQLDTEACRDAKLGQLKVPHLPVHVDCQPLAHSQRLEGGLQGEGPRQAGSETVAGWASGRPAAGGRA